MAVRDKCFVLKRFLLNDDSNTLIAICYFRSFGKKSVIVSNYFSKVKTGGFEPFNIIDLVLEQRNNKLLLIDTFNIVYFYRKNDNFYEKFIFLSKVARTILKFLNEADEEIFNLLMLTSKINNFFSFNYIRFLINLTNILGFSLENLNHPGWINLLSLTSCREDELKNSYCVYLSPKEFGILKRISNIETRPFEIKKSLERNLENFFYRFLEFRQEQF